MPNPGIPADRIAGPPVGRADEPERRTPAGSRIPAGRHAARVRRDGEGGRPVALVSRLVALVTRNAGARRAGAPRVGVSLSPVKGAHMHIPTRVAVAGAAAVALI